MKHLKEYVKLVESRQESSVGTSSTALETACPLTTIQRNCLHSANLRLASLEIQKTRSLLTFARQRRYPLRAFPPRVLTKFVKICQTNRGELDLTSSTVLQKEGVSISWNCNICPMMAKEKGEGKGAANDFVDEPMSDDQDEAEVVDAAAAASAASTASTSPRVVFVDPMLQRFNVFRFVLRKKGRAGGGWVGKGEGENVLFLFKRAIPIDTLDDWEKHAMQLHSVGIHDRKQHPHLLPCRLCRNNLSECLPNSFVCCLGGSNDD